jgi:hypothetical protein
MEDGLSYFLNKDDLRFFYKWKMASMLDNLNFFVADGRWPHLLILAKLEEMGSYSFFICKKYFLFPARGVN